MSELIRRSVLLLIGILSVEAIAAEPIRIGDGIGPQLDSVRVIAISPDNQLLAVTGEPADADKPRRVLLIDLPSGKLRHGLPGHIGPIREMTFSPDGRFLIASSSEPIEETTIRDVRTGETRHRLDIGGPSLVIPETKAAGGGSRLLIASPDTLRVVTVDLRTGQETGRTERSRFPVRIAPNGSRFLSKNSRDDPRFWRFPLPTGDEQPIDAGLSTAPPVTAVALSPDGRTLATTDGDHTLILFDLVTGRTAHQVGVGTKKLSRVGFDADGEFLLAASYDGSVSVIDWATGEIVHQVAAHRGPVTDAVFSPDRRWLVSGGIDRTVAVTPTDPWLRSTLPSERPDAEAVRLAYRNLAVADPATALRAVGLARLHADVMLPTFETELREVLLPAQNERILALLDDLDDPSDLIRDRAMDELRKLRTLAQPLLKKTLRETASAEVRYRLRRILLGSEEVPRFSPSDLRQFRRLVQLSDQIGDQRVSAVLQLIVDHLPNKPIVAEAQAVLGRIGG